VRLPVRNKKDLAHVEALASIKMATSGRMRANSARCRSRGGSCSRAGSREDDRWGWRRSTPAGSRRARTFETFRHRQRIDGRRGDDHHQ